MSQRKTIKKRRHRIAKAKARASRLQIRPSDFAEQPSAIADAILAVASQRLQVQSSPLHPSEFISGAVAAWTRHATATPARASVSDPRDWLADLRRSDFRAYLAQRLQLGISFTDAHVGIEHGLWWFGLRDGQREELAMLSAPIVEADAAFVIFKLRNQ